MATAVLKSERTCRSPGVKSELVRRPRRAIANQNVPSDIMSESSFGYGAAAIDLERANAHTLHFGVNVYSKRNEA